MRLYLFKGECLDDLKSNIKKNRKKYIDNTLPWLDEYFGIEKYRIPTNIEVETPKLIKSSNNKDYDLENSIALFESLKSLTPVLATDEMLWAYLCHVEYYDYIQSRWPIKSNDTTTIKSRYFFDGSRARGTARNGLSRLWWASFMTYDGTRENSYEFTKLLLNNQDEFESIIDRSLTRSKNVLFALLTVLSETEHKREDFRALMRRLNRIGGVTMLSILSIDELKGIISKYLNEIIQENNKATTEENVATKQNISIFRRFVSPLKGQKTTV